MGSAHLLSRTSCRNFTITFVTRISGRTLCYLSLLFDDCAANGFRMTRSAVNSPSVPLLRRMVSYHSNFLGNLERCHALTVLGVQVSHFSPSLTVRCSDHRTRPAFRERWCSHDCRGLSCLSALSWPTFNRPALVIKLRLGSSPEQRHPLTSAADVKGYA